MGKLIAESYQEFLNERLETGNDLLKAYKKYGFKLDRNFDGLYLEAGPASVEIRHADASEDIEDTTIVVELNGKEAILTGEKNIKKVLDDGLIDKIKNYKSNASGLDSYLNKVGFIQIR